MARVKKVIQFGVYGIYHKNNNNKLLTLVALITLSKGKNNILRKLKKVTI